MTTFLGVKRARTVRGTQVRTAELDAALPASWAPALSELAVPERELRAAFYARFPEEALAVASVLGRAESAARRLVELLELEAAGDEQIAELHRSARKLRKAIAVRLVDVAVDARTAGEDRA